MEEDIGTSASAAEVAQYAAEKKGKKRRLLESQDQDQDLSRATGTGRGTGHGAGGGQGGAQRGASRQGEGKDEEGTTDSRKVAFQASVLPSAAPAVPLKGDPKFHATRRSLPLTAHRAAIAQAVRTSASVVLCGETGSGKTTQVPQLLLEAGVLPSVYLPSSRSGAHAEGGGGGMQHTYAQQLQAVVTQPRRVAAITLAKRVAAEVGSPLGGTVGYTVRFDDVSGPSTRLRYLTDGMLLREAITDPLLSKIGVVVLDECHERSLNTDVLFGVVKRAQIARAGGRARAPGVAQGQRQGQGQGGTCALVAGAGHTLPPLKVIVMSATLDIELFASYFGNAQGGQEADADAEGTRGVSVLSIPGRSFPVTLYYAPEPVEDFCAAAVTTVLQIAVTAGSAPGDILVFLPGQEEIEDVASVLRSKDSMLALVAAQGGDSSSSSSSSSGASAAGESSSASPLPLGLTVVPLYASLSPEVQLLAFEPPPGGTRKVILSTNIAETSVTISGVRYVVDSGKVKVRSTVSSGRGSTGLGSGPGAGPVGVSLESLTAVDVSQSQAIQRAGRAGREAAGECYRLYTEEAFDGLPVSPAPEIARVNLSSVLLQLLGMGLPGTHALAFPWLEPPPVASLRSALCLLRDLGAVASCPVASPAAATPSAHGAPAPRAPILHGLPAPVPLAGARPVEFGLTDTGRTMTALPLDPILTSLLLSCLQEGVASLGLGLVAICAGESPFVFPGRDKEGQAAAARKAFISLEGDHLTLLNVLLGFERVVAGAAREVSQNMGSNLLSAQGFHGKRGPPPPATAAGSTGTLTGQARERSHSGAPVEVHGVKVITMMEDDPPDVTGGGDETAPLSSSSSSSLPGRDEYTLNPNQEEEEDPVPVSHAGARKDDTASLASNPRAPSRGLTTAPAATSGARGMADAQAILYRWAGRNARVRPGSSEGSSLQALTGVRSCMDVLISCGMAVIRAAASADDSTRTSLSTAQPQAQAQALSPKAGAAAKKAARIFTAAVGKRVSSWCWDHFTSLRALRQAVSVRDQLATQCHALGLTLATTPAGKSSSAGTDGPSDADKLRRALLAGCFMNVARRLPGAEAGARPQYRTLVGGVTCAIHPSSALVVAHAHARNKAAASAAAAARAGRVLTNSGPGVSSATGAGAGAGAGAGVGGVEELGGYPDTVIFAELVQTEGSQSNAGKGVAATAGGGPKIYMRTVTRMETEWLSTIRPDFFAAVH